MIAGLYDQIYANPDDDELRRILADALMDAGDPRGELILYQLRPDADHTLRAMKLVQQHGLSWLGPLRGAVIPLAYERGFLASAQIIDTVAANRVKDAREWATVESIELDGDSDEPPEFLPACRALVTIARVGHHVLDYLAKQREMPAKLVRIRTHAKKIAIDRLRTMPKTIRAIDVSGGGYDRAEDGTWIRRGA